MYLCYNDTILKKQTISFDFTQIGASVFFEGQILFCLQTDSSRHIYCMNDINLVQFSVLQLKISDTYTSCLATIGNFLLVLDHQNCILIFDKRLRNIKTIRNCSYLHSFYNTCFFLQQSKIWFVDKYLNISECSQINCTEIQNGSIEFCQGSAVFINKLLYFINDN